jgi:hypothetical protein
MAKKRQSSHFRSGTAVVGGLLLMIGFLWLGWIFFSHRSPASLSPTQLLPGLIATPTPNLQFAPLHAQGITLRATDQKPALSRQQALEIANRLEPDAASRAKGTDTRYALLSYPMTKTPVTHPDWNNVAVWMVLYQQIPQSPGDTSFDPKSPSQSYHDLYVFLDANSGQELFSLWA